MDHYIVISKNELYHYGIKGMKWGKHKRHFDVGYLNPEDRQRYSNINGQIGALKRSQMSASAKSGTLTNQYNTLKRDQVKLQTKFNSAYSRKKQQALVPALDTTEQGIKETRVKMDQARAEEIAIKRNTAAFLQEKSRMEVRAISDYKSSSVFSKIKKWLSNKVFGRR